MSTLFHRLWRSALAKAPAISHPQRDNAPVVLVRTFVFESSRMPNPVEVWKAEKHGFDVWPDVLRYAEARTPMADIETPDLERMKWYGAYYRKRDGAGTYMLRIRLTGCELNSEQAKTIAHIAYELGY